MIHAMPGSMGYQTKYSNGSHASVADVPVEKGGEGQGFGPHELLEAALATCMVITVRKHAIKQGVELTNVGCTVVADRTVPTTVTLRYALTLDGKVSEEQRQQLHDAAASCPVAKTLRGALAIASDRGSHA